MDELQAGITVDHYQLRGRLGAGGMGEVWLARDTRLGRRVALKFLRKRDPEAIRRFLQEARHTARFSHPNIVTTYTAGHWHGRPYLALEYLEGDSLRQRLRADRPSLWEAVRIGHAVADAVREAHAHGVLHLDIKPSNVLLARDGRPRVLDFGLAVSAGERIERTAGTPAYMAPERWSDAAPTAAVDVWSLGVLLYELVTGGRPWQAAVASTTGVTRVTLLVSLITAPEPAPPLPTGPEPLRALVDACLRKDPAQRPSIQALVDTLAELLQPAAAREDAPFRGLAAYDEAHARVFFGREREIAEAVERLREVPCLAVVGASGSGKSSLVLAGIAPRLREQGVWQVLRMRPGRDPLGALADALDTLGRGVLDRAAARLTPTVELTGDGWDEPTPLGALSLVDDVCESPARLGLVLQALAETLQARLLLVVDQLEELVTQVEDPAVRARFVAALAAAADDPSDPVRVLVTVRDDFLGHLAEAGLDLSQVLVARPLDTRRLAEALRQAAGVAGYRFEDEDLPVDLAAEVADASARLPLVQFAARVLWERRDRRGRVLRRADLVDLGGVAGALAGHAEEVLASLTPIQRDRARALFLRLVHADGTRRPVARADLDDDDEPVLGRLLAARLVVERVDRGEVELAHEALVGAWDRLGRWLLEAREDVHLRAQVDQAADLWAARGEPAAELWRGEALRDALRGHGYSERARRFLAAGQAAEARHRTRRRLLITGTSVALALTALVSTGAALSFRGLQREAEAQRFLAEDAQARALVMGAVASRASGDRLASRAQLRASLELRDSVAARVAWWRASHDPVVWTLQAEGAPGSVALSPDGSTLATSAEDTVVRLVDTATRAVRVLGEHGGPTSALAWDGETLLSADYDGGVQRWGAEPTTWSLDGDFVSQLRPAGEGIAALGYGRRAPLYTWGEAPIAVPGVVGARALAVAPDASWVATGPRLDGPVEVRPLDDLAAPRVVDTVGPDERLWVLAPAPTGDRLAVVLGHEVRVRTLDGDLLTTLPLPGARIVTAAWSAAGLVTADDQGVVHVWDPAAGDVRSLTVDLTLPLKRGDAAGGLLVLTDVDRTALVDPSVTPIRPVSRGHTRPVIALASAPDGRILSGAEDGTVREWSADGRELAVHASHDGAVNQIAVHASGAWATAGSDGTVQLHTGADVIRLELPHEALGLSWGADELVAVDWSNHVVAWDLDGEERWRARVPETTSLMAVAHTGDGRVVVGAANGQLWVFDDPRRPARALPRAHGDAVSALAGGPGATVVSGSYDGTVRRWDVDTGRDELLGDDFEVLGRVALRGERVAWTTVAGGVAVLREGSRVDLSPGHRGAVYGLALLGDADVLTGGNDGTVRRLGPAGPRWGSAAPESAPPVVVVGALTVTGTSTGEVLVTDAGGVRADLTLQDTPRLPVTALGPGPGGTLLVGWASGQLGLWELDTGRPLLREKLHGPVTELAWGSGHLQARTELGDVLDLDLDVLEASWCAVLAQVVERVPVTWDGRRVVREAGLPAGHPCAGSHR